MQALTTPVSIEFKVRLDDGSGAIQRTVVLYRTLDQNTWSRVELPYDQATGTASTIIEPVDGTVEYFVQAVDPAGNVALALDHGVPFRVTATLPPNQARVTLRPNSAGTLTYTDGNGKPTQVSAPAGAVTVTTTLLYTSLPSATPAGQQLLFAGHAFTLDGYRNGVFVPGLTFPTPVEVSITYSDADVAGMDEISLTLFYWNGSQWIDAATTCSPSSTYTRDLPNNVLSVPICHLSKYGLFGQPTPTAVVLDDFAADGAHRRPLSWFLLAVAVLMALSATLTRFPHRAFIAPLNTPAASGPLFSRPCCGPGPAAWTAAPRPSPPTSPDPLPKRRIRMSAAAPQEKAGCRRT